MSYLAMGHYVEGRLRRWGAEESVGVQWGVIKVMASIKAPTSNVEIQRRIFQTTVIVRHWDISASLSPRFAPELGLLTSLKRWRWSLTWSEADPPQQLFCLRTAKYENDGILWRNWRRVLISSWYSIDLIAIPTSVASHLLITGSISSPLLRARKVLPQFWEAEIEMHSDQFSWA